MAKDSSRTKTLGLVGFGAIGSGIVRLWRQSNLQYRLVAVCVRPHQIEEARNAVTDQTAVTVEIAQMAALELDVVIEAAGHELVIKHGPRFLSSGSDLMLLSVGALANEAAFTSLRRAAASGNSRILIPSGALAGFDGIRSLRQAGGLRSVAYTSTKPPRAWLGTPAETKCDLASLTARRVLFEGTAREAARLYPKNANLAASVALAGIGFDATQVELIADPTVIGNQGTVRAVGLVGELNLCLAGIASDCNPKTSEITSRSVIAALQNSVDACTFL